MIRIGNIFLYLLFSYSLLFSQTNIVAELSHTKVRVGEVFTLSVSVDGGAEVRVGDVDGLLSRGSGKSVSVVFSSGVLQRMETYSFNYVALDKGVYTIDDIEVKIKNKKYKANSVSIEVVEDSSDIDNSDSLDNFLDYKDDVIATNIISKKEVYVYEPIYIEQKLYTHIYVNVLGSIQAPDRNDFISYSDTSKRAYTEIINGKRISIVPLKREVLYPIKKGKKKIETTEFVIEKDNMFFDRVQIGREVFDINVLPLPKNDTGKKFSGAVGDFDFRVSANNTNINTGDEVIVTLEVFGEGNVSVIDIPNLDSSISNYFSVYQPKTFETNWFENGKIFGRKTKEYILIATNSGNYSISNISFLYFSPNIKRYTNTYSTQLNFNISGEAISHFDNNSREDSISSEDSNDVIKYNISNRVIKNEDKDFILLNIKYVYYISLLFLLIYITIFVFAKIKKKDKVIVINDTVQYDKILEYYNSNNRVEYCKSILDYLTFNTNSNLNTIYSELKKYNIDEEIIKNIKSIIDSCQFELYSGNNFNNQNYHSDLPSIIETIKKSRK